MLDNISLIAQSAIKIKNKSGKIIYFDPFKLGEDCKNDADYIFITHPHFDHFSPEDISKIKKEETKVVAPRELGIKLKELNFTDSQILKVDVNKDYIIDELEFKTVAAYNLNKDFHKKQYNWVGYVVKIDNQRIYIAGDTDNIEEARNVKCDIACVPIGGTYTMNYNEAADLIKTIQPEIAIPIHYQTIVGNVEDAYKFKDLLKEYVEVKILLK